ncbi:hypothetical protein [Bythopirellula polymerisocia]|uniref:Uncharacterized protein n=1 Tax=Bythopirellula polymerisocia TaxID=2528003 RepID=A0A5C6CZA5_9BACT|nr:hypothetical protein [Bythopirellula polymerisocia]TWU29930.1 hypothetical protein Pla144_07110 [Bythopirellula polymerisocia]
MLRSTNLVCFIVFLCCSLPTSADEPAVKDSQAERESDLASSLSGATLVGNFTITGQEQLALKPERYELTSVKHLEGDNWLFVARIQYGDHDVTLPIALPILWAGDTPVITVDNIGFPGLGTYSARVMIYDDHYAGFWSGADHGGHLFGVVERGDATPPAAE